MYTFLVPYQLHRFIELMKASGKDFSSKMATQVTTSKHFYDITAHRFIEDNCADMGIRFLDGLSADMDDILSEKGRKQATDWLEFSLWKADRGEFKEHVAPKAAYSPGTVTVPSVASEKKAGRKAVIVTDLLPGDDRLKGMIERFVSVFPYGTDVINIEDFPFQGGCLSCFNCASTGRNQAFSVRLAWRVTASEKITGSPAAWASTPDTGRPSKREGSRNRSMACMSPATS